MKTLITSLLILVLTTTIGQNRTNPKTQNVELGKVSWYRDYDEAIMLSRKQNKPILILFQEVPGCSTCVGYGNNVLSNPLLTDAIENEFIPLAIYNNKGGKDRKILEKYDEPTWNNPVVRIVDQDGKNIVKRVAGNYSAVGLYGAMTTALKKSGKTIPEYVSILGDELNAEKRGAKKETYYSMYCFWTGEKQLGSQEGVVNTEAGFMNGREVVKVTYDVNYINQDKLNSFASRNSMKPMNKHSSYRPAKKDEDYYLQHSDYKYLPLSPLQRTKINSALGSKKNPSIYLSPSQKKWLKEIKHNNTKVVLFNQPFHAAWSATKHG